MKIQNIVHWYAYFFTDFDQSKAYQMLADFEIDLDEKASQLFKGTLAKLGLILALSRNAEYYILDEPLEGVDPASRDEILDMMIQFIDGEKTIIISTHLISDVERILDHIIFIKNGKVVENDSADSLRDHNNSSIDEKTIILSISRYSFQNRFQLVFSSDKHKIPPNCVYINFFVTQFF